MCPADSLADDELKLKEHMHVNYGPQLLRAGRDQLLNQSFPSPGLFTSCLALVVMGGKAQ